MSRTIEIGKKDKELFIFGGVYSNLQALRAVRRIAEDRGFRPEDIICTGDIVAYCAHPAECIDEIENWGIHCIAGNVELNLRDEAEDCGCNFSEGSRCEVFSRQWYAYVESRVSNRNRGFIEKLPEFLSFEFYGLSSKVVHGSYHNTSEFIFASSPDEVFERNFRDAEAELIIAGHCGLPFVKELKGKTWVNAGVIGMPANDGTRRTWCGVLGLTQKKPSFEFIPVQYDYEEAAKAMQDKGLPQTYATTLRTGLWDNCDILPPVETHAQGRELLLNK